MIRKVVWCCSVLLWTGISFAESVPTIPAVPRYRILLAEKLKVSESVMAELERGRLRQLSEQTLALTDANLEFEEGSLKNHQEEIVQLTNGIPRYVAQCEVFKKEFPVGFARLFDLMDSMAKQAECVKIPDDLVEALRVRREIAMSRRVLIAGLDILVAERRHPDALRLKAGRLKESVEGRILPSCRKWGGDKKFSSRFENALATYQKGLSGVEAGYWSQGVAIMMIGKKRLEDVQAEAQFLDLE